MSNKTAAARWFVVLGVGLALTSGCSGRHSARTDGAPGLGSSISSPLAVANALPSIRVRLDAHEDLELRGDAFALASINAQRSGEPSLPNAFSVVAPRTLSKALRLSRDADTETWLEMRALGTRDAQGAVEQGAVVYRTADVDLDVVLSLGNSRLEELRVLRSAKAQSTARYSLSVAPGMQLRALEGGIEALDASGRVAFRTNAAFAVDSAGTERSVTFRLDGNELSTSFDSTRLTYPVVVDPEWVTGPTWPHEAVVAQNSAELSSSGTVVGDVTVIERRSGTFLGSLAPAQLDSGAQLSGTLRADSIRLEPGSVITGDAHFNTLSGAGIVRGERFPTLALPVPVSAPNFPAFTVGTQDITTSSSAPLQLAAGSYRNLNLKSGTTLRLTGGVYAFSSISFGSKSRFECLAACDVRLLSRFVEASGGFFGPATGATIGPDSVEVFVSSANGSSSLSALPAVVFGPGSAIRGRFFAPNGTVSVASGVQVVGTLVGRDVVLSSAAQVVKDNPTTPTCTANDNNPCTQDSCNAAGQAVFTPLPAGTSCADTNVCNGMEACNGVGICAPGAPLATDDGNPCTTDSCDPATGVKHQPVATGASCSDGNACNGAETCNATSQCTAGSPPVIDDGNPCTSDACDPVAGVTHQPVVAGASCSDRNACNGTEVCNASGACLAGTPPSTDDNNPCTTDSCDPRLGVVHAPVAAGTSCSDGNACNGSETCDTSGTCAPGSAPALDDGNPCTADSCDALLGVVHLPLSGTSCSDGNACNGSELCQAGACASGTPPVLDDGNPCTADACDPTAGVTHVAVANGTSCSDGNACNGPEMCASGACATGSAPTIDDGNPCTADSCDAKTGIHHMPVATGTSCSDGNACNGSETCSGSGSCIASAPPIVDDGNPCTADACDPATGVTHTALPAGTSCSDGNACNGAEACTSSGACAAGAPPVVDDGNLCTADSCDPATGVQHVPVATGTSCSDGNACNGSESCDGSGACTAGSSPLVDDGNPCTADSCDPATGVKHTPLAHGTSCSDGNACNGNEICDGSGVCAAGTPLVIDDGNPCTTDACDPASGVAHTPTPSGSSCADANLCNGTELCDGAGKCAAGSPLAVDDGNPCTVDSCDPTAGVAHTPTAAGTSCSDSNVCNGAEQCNSSGVCTPGTSLTIDDGNPCTSDSCDPVSGVHHAPAATGTSCESDGNICNGVSSCDATGACAPGTPLTLDDGNPCTVDSCDPVLGVKHLAAAPGTVCSAATSCGGAGQCDATGNCAQPSIDDGNPCTVDTCDSATGKAIHSPAPAGASCAPLDSCHSAGTCDSVSRCNPGPPISHDDGDPCTIETCDPIAGFKQRSCAPLDPTVATVLADANAWIYSGTDPLQSGVAPGTIVRKRATLLKGLALTRDGFPLSGAQISVARHPEFGSTTTQTNGEFEMVVNGGSGLAVRVQKVGFLTSDRTIDVPWATTVQVPDITAIQADPVAANVDLADGSSDFHVVKGLAVSDTDGQRQPTVLVPPGTEATMLMPDGTSAPLNQLHVRVTEFTVGPDGPSMMPASLPSTTAYTHAFEINADEAVAAGATSVKFTQPLVYYVDNFLHFPTGTVVPLGSYDRTKGTWVIEKSGTVIQVVGVANGVAQININADPAAESPAELIAAGITAAEQAKIGQLYVAGQSLWRVQLPHFTSPYDTNWARSEPNASPPLPPNNNRDDNNNISFNNITPPCGQAGGSTVECQNQTLREELPIAGTPFKLDYSSARMSGRKGAYQTFIPISGDSVPTTPIPLLRIDLDVEIAGSHFKKSFPAQPNQSYTFNWDGLDNFGRLVQGVQTATISVSYIYPTHYVGGELLFEDFAPGDPIIGIGPGRTEVPVTRIWTKRIGQWDQSRSPRLGGWTLSVHNDYNPTTQILTLGTGDTVRADALPLFTQALAPDARALAVASDGTVFVALGGPVTNVLGKVVNGTLSTVGGNNGVQASTGDGGPLSAATFTQIRALAFDELGNLLILDQNSLRRVDQTGTITLFAGNGQFGTLGDGGPAVLAQLSVPQGADTIAVHDGKVYIAAANFNGPVGIRAVDPDGVIRTVAGTGQPLPPGPPTTFGTSALLTPMSPTAIAFDGAGNLYYVDAGNYVGQIRKDGSVHLVAGCGGACTKDIDGFFTCGPACSSTINGQDAKSSAVGNTLAVAPDGTLYLSTPAPAGGFLSKVTPEGILSTIQNSSGFPDIKVGQDGLYFIQGTSAVKLGPAMPGIDISSINIPSSDGSQLHIFDQTGRHLETRDAITGAHVYQFGYDPNGLLSAISDPFGNTTKIERTSDGTATAVVAPYGQRTTLSVGDDGLLASVTDPSGNDSTMFYTPGGLLTSLVNVRGFASLMSYDGSGRVITDVDPAGAAKTVTRTDLSDGWSTSVKSSAAGTTSYEIHNLPDGSQRRIVTSPDGTVGSDSIASDGTTTTVLADGTTVSRSLVPDPRWGFAAPVVTETTTLPSGLKRVVQRSRQVTLSNPTDPFTLLTFENRTSINNSLSTQVFSSATRTWTSTTPSRRTSTLTLDGNDNVLQSQTGPSSFGGLLPTSLRYDSHGRPSVATRGSRMSQSSYFDTNDVSNGYVSGAVDALSQTTTFTRDAFGRALSVRSPGDALTALAWDPSGNLSSLTPPSRPEHSLGYTPVDQVGEYKPPTLMSLANPITSYEYNLARQLATVTRPDGALLRYAYDDAGRLSTVTTPDGVLTNRYFGTAPCAGCASGKVSQILGIDGVNLAFTFDGFLQTGTSWTGAVSGSVTQTYTSQFQVASESISAGSKTSPVPFNYDGDGILQSAGAMTLGASSNDGQFTDDRLINVLDFYTYNGFAELADQTSFANGVAVFRETYDNASVSRDALGRIVQKIETLQGVQTVFQYAYDADSRLKNVIVNGAQSASYVYDPNGNRLSATTSAGTSNATYDDQDRLLTHGNLAYSYTANGELETKTNITSGDVTAYKYDAFGNLKRVDLPNGDVIVYLVDGQNRRVSKAKNGVLVKQWLYRDQLHPVAELDSSGNLVSTFVYATGKNVPDYMIQNGTTFRIFSDQVGSPRLVVDATTGALKQRMRHDEFGNILEDTNPGLTPFGFGGGLYDADTGLVRFGARDYDPIVGRWISKDPIRFDGGQANLYVYVDNDPIQNADEDGLALRACAKALAKLAAAEARLAKRRFENMTSSCGSDPGHDKAMDEAQNAVENASEQVARNCTAKDLAVLGAAGLLAGAVGSLSGGGSFAFAF